MHKLIATGLGIGYIRKGGGTVASVVCCAVWYMTQLHATHPGGFTFFFPVLITVVLTVVGIWSATVVEQQWGKDNYRVVIDEIAGMCISLLFVPITLKSLLTGLFLFRLFDIAKPLGIRKLEQLKGGWGVMLDDVLAGLYANVLLQVVWATGLL
ncbi:phosphatidylglycerophosphatase A family protein [Spirosoma radiotolerans]|uniref:Phosphatidylglycerophosphatase n=1 Tax=Spirosoma radiotolerans TaxID=1379870 RepID=A0A0E3ZXB0_9BACT|nr:phosphatidylglycerophosphatase A [Spirosoma radiotolerans]AKD56828.1 phosphatidylglycerophosphatase [Spirosoma radiotolerans]